MVASKATSGLATVNMVMCLCPFEGILPVVQSKVLLLHMCVLLRCRRILRGERCMLKQSGQRAAATAW